ncbi:hypothetical protein ALO70_102723 [Pseudomonas amygdali pv. eriobotryae]|uniref:Uncharacterized protein n=1 Tax=Pseudomonas amygdali pv. eriobotryae TaxID=129137 RepID=A0A0P9VEX9_PSEA0|nr:hypothetical protein ALO70_102723 [Pseudomonas amygdali pv. eriobotryae]
MVFNARSKGGPVNPFEGETACIHLQSVFRHSMRWQTCDFINAKIGSYSTHVLVHTSWISP